MEGEIEGNKGPSELTVFIAFLKKPKLFCNWVLELKQKHRSRALLLYFPGHT